MHPSVRAAWKTLSEPFEGRVLSMYLDIKGLVTCGVGNLIDTPAEALKIPWYRTVDGARAREEEVCAAWNRLKDHQEYSRKSTASARALTGLMLKDEDVDALVERKLNENDAYITEHWFPRFQEITADAQLAILSMAWAVGPAFNKKFPTFTASALLGRWWECATNCKIREEGNPGVIPRNKANRLCFENAAAMAGTDADRTVLHWPNRYAPPMAQRLDAPEQIAGGTIAEAVAAATDARFDALNDLRSDAHDAMAIDPNDAADEDEDTVPDLPSNIP